VATQTDLAEFREDKVDRGASRTNFGAGKVNTVAKLVYNTSTGPQTRIFKPEPEKQDHLVPAAQNIGLDKDNPNFGKRNIASRKVCEQLGLGDLIPKADFTTFNGQVGLAMGFAPGKALVGSRKLPIGEDADPDIRHYLDEANPVMKEGWAQNLKSKGISQAEDGQWFKSETVFRDIPYENSVPPQVAADIQKGLVNMQWLDCFVGQVDRQPENYMVNVEPGTNQVTVTGIDNDFSFGPNLTGVETLTVNGETRAVNPNTCTANQGFNYCGFPPLIDRALYDSLVTHDLSWDDFSRDLGALVSGPELAAAQGRFNELKARARQMGLDGLVVDDWTAFRKDGKSAAQLMKDDPRKNYFNRDVRTVESARARRATEPL
jgi:hypothetical protein